MSEVPLYGIAPRAESEALFTMRVVFASKYGTLMELGIGPIVTAGLIIQLLAGSGLIEVDFSNPEDRALFTTASKALSIIMTIFQASMYIVSGAYGRVDFTASLLILLQLIAAGLIIMLLDELVQKWGIGSGISLFIVAGISQRIWWNSFSMLPVGDGKRLGAIPAFFEAILRREPVWSWFHRAGGFPDMVGFLTTLLLFLTLIFMEGMRVELPISHALYRGFRGRMPLKLIYVSNIPVILAYTLFSNIQIISQTIWQRWNVDNSNLFLNLLGMFNMTERGPMPIGGLVYYITFPGRLEAVFREPIRAVIYALIVITVCILFSKIWIEVGGMGPESVAEQLIKSGMQIPGFRRSKRPVERLLRRYIPTISILGGLIIGVISAVSQFLGVFSTGTGVLLCVSILYQYYQAIVQEQIEELYPLLREALR
jgi:preprotein translocase SecY subunit